jgi:aminoglycoside/choline kinase family phosphotransferase
MDPRLPRDVLEAMVVAALGASVDRIDEMPGGASTRRYLRVFAKPRAHAQNKPKGASAVAMWAPDGARPEEITAGGPPARWPFLEVRDLLARAGVRVPELLGDRSDVGLLLLEDLGDVTLAEAIRVAPERRRALYARAVRDLAKMHAALQHRLEGTIVATRAFDEALLRWELAHFVEWGLDARGVVLSTTDRAALDDAFDRIARDLASRPRGFVHRDYQSRNLMIDPRDDDALVVIDFQDALMGPRSYDMVALMRDSYQDLDEAFVGEMLAIYGDTRGFDHAQRDEMRDELDRLTVQRKLKDAGRFVFIERKKGDPSFLPYVTPSLKRVRGALERLGDRAPFDVVRAVLARAMPEHFG